MVIRAKKINLSLSRKILISQKKKKENFAFELWEAAKN